MATITAIRSSRRGSKLRTILLDGEPWRDASSEVIAKAGLAEADEVDPLALRSTLEELEPACARDRAVRLLSYRDHSAVSMRDRLVSDGYPSGIARDVVADLERIGFIDDARVASVLARSLVEGRRLGRSRALREMLHAGLSEEVAAAALAEYLDAESEADTARALARTAAQRSGATVEKVAGRLLRRGYAPGVALRAAREAIAEAGRHAGEDAVDDGF